MLAKNKVEAKTGKSTILSSINFYTGIPPKIREAKWHHFWTGKMRHMKSTNDRTIRVTTFSRELRYSPVTQVKDGKEVTFEAPREKGIDVRLSLDLVRMATRNEFDIAVIFSQDQDLSEAVEEIRNCQSSGHVGKHVELYSSFPVLPHGQLTPAGKVWFSRGINGTAMIPFTQTEYETCIDTQNYFPKSSHIGPRKAYTPVKF